jgi:hypothetical protein
LSRCALSPCLEAPHPIRLTPCPLSLPHIRYLISHWLFIVTDFLSQFFSPITHPTRYSSSSHSTPFHLLHSTCLYDSSIHQRPFRYDQHHPRTSPSRPHLMIIIPSRLLISPTAVGTAERAANLPRQVPSRAPEAQLFPVVLFTGTEGVMRPRRCNPPHPSRFVKSARESRSQKWRNQRKKMMP